ncbi:hypothetical protein HUT18_13360 [Streptomyces sp. NA04227]|uniref:hypothetical protein n=1 Tax=Streptomyces sp. NA04227 TaxID=2742136 RepID=UPI001590C359|nr:hypothetical protein [Streptomyces sp. NA04227]QKW07233.1 hypothetical protein HUT18_13360 [Streptomyces sp. NA04227]
MPVQRVGDGGGGGGGVGGGGRSGFTETSSPRRSLLDGLSGLAGLGGKNGLGGLSGLGALGRVRGNDEDGTGPGGKGKGKGRDRGGDGRPDEDSSQGPHGSHGAQEPQEPHGLLPRGLRRRAPRPRTGSDDGVHIAQPLSDVPSPPHLAGLDEIGRGGPEPDWWRVDGNPLGPGERVPGFVGGIEIPEILKPPPQKADLSKGDAGKAAGSAPVEDEAADDEADADDGEEAGSRRRMRLPVGGWRNPLLLLAAATLFAGAVAGEPVALGVGWLLVWLSRKLTRAEAKAAVLVLPGLSLAGGCVWLWGRSRGRWGEAIAEGQMSDAIAETWPWVLRAAAITSALFVVWRSQRGK